MCSIYEDEYCYYFWKPANIPSTFGKEYAFLDYLKDQKQSKKIQNIISQGERIFWKEEEYGLLNRLDTPTTGLLYFAKNQESKRKYKLLQQEGKIKKYYIIAARGDLRYWLRKNGNSITLPIAHHRFKQDRMVVCQWNYEHKIKGRLHHVKTEIEECEFSEEENITTALVVIQKWIRHQIRSHFSAIWYPLLGDTLYGKEQDHVLQLISIGLSLEE